jgi:hypothetical protein
VFSYRKFSDTLKRGMSVTASPKPPKAPTVRQTLGGLGALAGRQAEIQNCAPLRPASFDHDAGLCVRCNHRDDQPGLDQSCAVAGTIRRPAAVIDLSSWQGRERAYMAIIQADMRRARIFVNRVVAVCVDAWQSPNRQLQNARRGYLAAPAPALQRTQTTCMVTPLARSAMSGVDNAGPPVPSACATC